MVLRSFLSYAPPNVGLFRIYAVLILRLAKFTLVLDVGSWTWTEAARSNTGSYPCTTVGLISLE